MTGKIFKNNRGVTLLELMVAVSIFAVLILSATGIFKLVLDGQRNSISSQNVQESMRYTLEKMSKEIRMAGLSDDACLAGATNKVFNTAAGDTELYFKNQGGVCVKYYLEAGRVKIQQGATEDFVTPVKLTVEDLKFYAVDNLIGTEPTVQPYVTLLMDVKNPGLPEQQQKLKLQASISSRYYNSVAMAEPDCTPSCSGKECGSDGCGGSCGSCAANQFCSAGSCEVNPSFCGDSTCNGTETCTTCPGDCGACVPTYYTVASVNMTNNGSGYTSAPSVSFSGGGGSGAAGTANLGNQQSSGGGDIPGTGHVWRVNLSNGGSYLMLPQVDFSGGGGSGAAATAVLSGVTYSITSFSAATPRFTDLCTSGGTNTDWGVSAWGGGGSGFFGDVFFDRIYKFNYLTINFTSHGTGYLPGYQPIVRVTDGITTADFTINNIHDGGCYGIYTDGDTEFASMPTITVINNSGYGTGAVAEAAITNCDFLATDFVVYDSGSGYTSEPDYLSAQGVTKFNLIPEMTPTSAGTISNITINNGGSNYTSAPTVSFSGGGGAVGTALITYDQYPIIYTYSVTSISVTNGGSNYTSTPAVVFSGGGGSGAAGTAVMQAQ